MHTFIKVNENAIVQQRHGITWLFVHIVANITMV